MGKHRSEAESEEVFLKLGVHSNSLLNDGKVDGEWVRSVRLRGTTYMTRAYSVWNGIKGRCTPGGAFQLKFPWYVGSTMCDEWRNDFNAFAEWYTSQAGYDHGWDIDKDSAGTGKYYSPSTCMLLPRAVNLLFSERHMPLNIVPAPLVDTPERCRTKDGRVFDNIQDARANARKLRLDIISELRTQYVPLGVGEEVFDRAASIVPV